MKQHLVDRRVLALRQRLDGCFIDIECGGPQFGQQIFVTGFVQRMVLSRDSAPGNLDFFDAGIGRCTRWGRAVSLRDLSGRKFGGALRPVRG